MSTKKEKVAPTALNALVSTFSEVQRNLEAEEKGVWLEVPLQEIEGVEFLIRSADCQAYTDYVAKQSKIRKAELRVKKLPSQELDIIIARAVAKFLVLNWKGINDAKGKAMTFDRDALVTLFEDRSMSQLVTFVHDAASTSATFKQELVEEDAKNS